MLTFADHIGMRLTDHSYGQANLNTVEGMGMGMGDESGASTPPLWSPTHQPQNIDYRCLSPSSKAEAIAQGQRELMEMVSRMPESCYELSLRDLVEHHQPPAVEAKQEINKKKKKKNNPKVAQIKRSGSMDNGGFLLKIVFPISLGSKKKKKTKSDTSQNFKACQKATVSDSCGKSVDKEWWKKRSGSSESESGGSTINSGSTKSIRSSSTSSSSSCSSISNSNRRHKKGSCLAFILRRKTKSSR